MQYVFGVLMTTTALFLIMLVLVQRGKGGGLAGAFGGAGGQSAFGTKAGDAFTKLTIGVSVFWMLLCILSVRFLGREAGAFGNQSPPESAQMAPAPGDTPLLPDVEPGAEPGAEPGDGTLPPADATPDATVPSDLAPADGSPATPPASNPEVSTPSDVADPAAE